MDEETPWLWSLGIAALCDHRVPDDFPRGEYDSHEDSLPRSEQAHYHAVSSQVCAGNLVWVKGDWLPYFVASILPDIKERFVLVSAGSVHSMPSSMPEESQVILESPKVIHWYTQNHDGTTSEKISPLPLGMDFHTIHRREYWGIRQLPARKQNEVLEMIRKKLPPIDKRKKALYIDSQFASRHDPQLAGAANELTRIELFQIMKSDPDVYIQYHFLPQFEMWMRRGQYTHVLSHHGAGLDCHRSWEALVLGHVLVVQKSSLDPLYKDLPVCIVDDWTKVEDISSSNLLDIDSKNPYRQEKLTNRYWIDKMRKRADQALHGKEGIQ